MIATGTIEIGRQRRPFRVFAQLSRARRFSSMLAIGNLGFSFIDWVRADFGHGTFMYRDGGQMLHGWIELRQEYAGRYEFIVFEDAGKRERVVLQGMLERRPALP